MTNKMTFKDLSDKSYTKIITVDAGGKRPQRVSITCRVVTSPLYHYSGTAIYTAYEVTIVGYRWQYSFDNCHSVAEGWRKGVAVAKTIATL